MLFTMTSITLATLAVATLPTYEQIGILAPILLVLCRVIQGFAMGGEVGTAMVYLLETAPAQKAGRSVSWILAGQGAATVVAGAIGTLLAVNLSHAEMKTWGWRMPFVLSVALGPLVLYLRRSMPETAALPEAPRTGNVSGLLHAMCDRRVVLLMVALMGGAAANYICSYLSTFAVAVLSMPASIALSATIVVGIATCAGAIAGGWLSDVVGNRRVLLWSRLACSLGALPAFTALLEYPSLQCLWAISAVLAITNGINGGALFVPLAQSFRQQERAAGVSFSYAVGLALFGGTSQFVVTELIGLTGIRLMPGLYMFVTGMISFIALFFLSDPKR